MNTPVTTWLVICSMLPVVCTAVVAQTTFEQRRAEVIDFYASNPCMFHPTNDRTGYAKAAPYTALAKYASGDIDGANEILHYVFTHPAGASMFLLSTGMDAYLRYGHHLPEETRTAARSFITGLANHPFGSTENHKVMTAMGGFLAAETWPDWAKGAQIKPTCREELMNFFTKIAARGLTEYNSPVYHSHFVKPLLSLSEFAKDQEVKQRALIGLEILLMDMAGQWVDGCWAAPTLRTSHLHHDSRDGAIAGLTGYVYFGGRQLPAQSDGPGVLSAVAPYRLPSIIERMGTDRRKPFTHRESNMAWHGARVTTYINKSYGVFSQYDGNNSLFWSDQMLRSGVVWSSDSFGAKFMVRNPKELERLRGETPGNQILQHEGVMVGVAREEMTGYVPQTGSVRETREENGWLFMDGETIYIAFTSRNGYRWGETVTVNGVAARYLIWDHANWSESYRQLTLEGGNRNGWVVQTAHPDEHEGFDAFINKVTSTAQADFSRTGDHDPRVTYTTIDGDVLEITFDARGGGGGTDRRRVNGVALDYAGWPRFENPWMQSDLYGEQLVLREGSYTRTYDFTNWTITEQGEPPVVTLPRAPVAGIPARTSYAGHYDLRGRAVPAPVRRHTGVTLMRSTDGMAKVRVATGGRGEH